MAREREVELSSHLSEHEALMWNVETDPWLNPSGASIAILDRPIDSDHFRRQMRASVAKMPRLYQRVESTSMPFETPKWVVDEEFDLDYHLRRIALPSPGTDRQLLDLAAQLFTEPLDRTRPLWRFVAIEGLEGGRGALFSMIHHVVSDGIGQIRMAEMYQQTERDAPAPDDIDLEAIVAKAASADAPRLDGTPAEPVSDAAESVAHFVSRQLDLGRQALGEVMMWGADPERARRATESMVDGARSAVSQLQNPVDESEDEPAGSPLLKPRSRNRRLDWVQVSVDGLKAAAHEVDASLNDALLAGVADGARRYHLARGVEVPWFQSSFVVSTRSDAKAGGNAFTPVAVRLPGGEMSIADRIATVATLTGKARERGAGSGGLSGLSGVINLLPTSLVTRIAREQAARIDFATSNLRGAPFELFCSGAKVLAGVPMGPVAGTGANITALSYNGVLDIGVVSDPAAIEDGAEFAQCIDDAFADMVGPAFQLPKTLGQTPPADNPAAEKPAAEKPAAKKPKSKKSGSEKKSGTKKSGTKNSESGAKKSGSKKSKKSSSDD